jgi:hypothetical protein
MPTACSPPRHQPQLPALLAPQDAGDLPRRRAVVHPHGRRRRRVHQGQGAQDAAPAGAGRDRTDRLLPGERPRPAARHDRRPARLVHQPPAQLGRAAAVLPPPDSGELHPRTMEILDQAADMVEAGGIEAWSKASPNPSSAPRTRATTPRATTSWRSGSTPAPRTPRCSRARTPGSGHDSGPRPTCTWKATTSTAAGSTPRC